MFTSRITPKMSERPAANIAYSPPISTPCTMVLIHSIDTLHPEIRGRDGVARHRRGRALQRDAALLQAGDVLRGAERLHDVLFDDDDRRAFGDDRRHAAVD